MISEKRNIIFLDIDGVLQPYNQRERFDHDLDKLVDYLCDKYNDPIYGEMDKYDVGAAYYDWDDVAVGILTKLIRVSTQEDCIIADNYLLKMLTNKTYSGVVAIDKEDSEIYETVNKIYYHPVELGEGYVMFYKPFRRNWFQAFDIYDYNRKEIVEYAKGIIDKLTVCETIDA